MNFILKCQITSYQHQKCDGTKDYRYKDNQAFSLSSLSCERLKGLRIDL